MPSAKMTNFVNSSKTLKRKITLFLSFLNKKKYPFFFFLIAVFFLVYSLILSQINSRAELKENNFNSFLKIQFFNLDKIKIQIITNNKAIVTLIPDAIIQ